MAEWEIEGVAANKGSGVSQIDRITDNGRLRQLITREVCKSGKKRGERGKAEEFSAAGQGCEGSVEEENGGRRLGRKEE